MKFAICLLIAACSFLVSTGTTAATPLPALPDPMTGVVVPGGPPPVRTVWNKIPIPIVLPVRKERLVMFPVEVRVRLPLDIGGDEFLRTQIVDGTIYWTALKAFPVKRVEVQAIESENIYLLDLSASTAAPADPVEVTLREKSAGKPGSAPGVVQPGAAVPGPVAEAPAVPKAQDYVTLTRMAAQHLYSPRRLLRVPDGVHRVPLKAGATQTLVRGAVVDAIPLIAWRSGGQYVTAVKLRNSTYSTVVLDPRQVRGSWLTCAFQHGQLAPRGDQEDTTSAYLISARPYEEAINGK